MTTVIRTVLLAIIVNAALTARAIQTGWQLLPGGGIEYLVQVEPELLDSFHREGYTSDLSPNLRDIRRIRITVGEEKLPNQNDLLGPPQRPPEATTDNQKSAINPGGGVGVATPKDSATTEAPTSPASTPENQAGALTDWSQPPANRGVGDTASATSPASADQTLPPIPFLHSSMGRHAAGNNPSTLNQAAKVDDPRLPSDEGPRDGGATAENFQVANKPPISNSPSQNGGSSEAATPKPWWALMAALLALFGSLGANAYLVWIHQAVRAKYRALLQRSPLGGAAA